MTITISSHLKLHPQFPSFRHLIILTIVGKKSRLIPYFFALLIAKSCVCSIAYIESGALDRQVCRLDSNANFHLMQRILYAIKLHE